MKASGPDHKVSFILHYHVHFSLLCVSLSLKTTKNIDLLLASENALFLWWCMVQLKEEKAANRNASTIIAFVENVFPLQSIKEQAEEEGMGLKKRRKNLRRKKDSKFDQESARLPLLQPLITHLVCGSNQSVAYPRRRICTAQSSVKFHCLWQDHTCSLSPTISRAITTSGKVNLQSYLSPDRSTEHHSHLIFQMCIPLWIKSRFQIQSFLSFHSS